MVDQGILNLAVMMLVVAAIQSTLQLLVRQTPPALAKRLMPQIAHAPLKSWAFWWWPLCLVGMGLAFALFSVLPL